MWKWLSLTLVLVVMPVWVFAETFTWVDSQGTMHFSDDLSSVPKQYRKKVRRLQDEDVTPEAEPAPAGDGAPATSPAASATAPAPAKKEPQQGKKEALYGGKTADAWRQDIVYARTELTSARNQLADTKARLNDTSKMSRSEYLGINQQIKSFEASIKGMEERCQALLSSAGRAGVPESVLR